jgi:hypothetical protein
MFAGTTNECLKQADKTKRALLLDKVNFPLALPPLRLFFSSRSIVDIVVQFNMNKPFLNTCTKITMDSGSLPGMTKLSGMTKLPGMTKLSHSKIFLTDCHAQIGFERGLFYSLLFSAVEMRALRTMCDNAQFVNTTRYHMKLRQPPPRTSTKLLISTPPFANLIFVFYFRSPKKYFEERKEAEGKIERQSVG